MREERRLEREFSQGGAQLFPESLTALLHLCCVRHRPGGLSRAELRGILTEQRREPVTTVPDSEGRVRCPLPDCGKLLGSYIPAKSQYYCRHCRVEVMVGTPSLEMRLNAYDLSLSASNMSKAQMLALFLVTDARTSASRARALELLAALPDDDPVRLPEL